MPDFGEMLEGVEIMRVGTHTASNGERVAFEAADLRKLAAGYDPAFHEAPVVIGHPDDNQPAYGWVKKLAVVGDKLVATLDLVPQFVEAVRQGLFKKRSASIYKDLDGKGLYLRHVGFLGAVPPAVKALADISLKDSEFESYTVEFEERKPAMNWKDWFKKRIDEMPEDGAPVVITQGNPPAAPLVRFTEEQVKEREKAAAEAATKKALEAAEADFSERAKKQDAEREAAAHQAAVTTRLDDLAKAGKIIPAWRKAGLDEFAQALGYAEETVFAFSEGDAKVRKSPCDWFFSFLEKLPKAVNFDEFAGRDKDPGKGGAAEKLEALTRKKMEGDKTLSYRLAFSEVQTENPDLAREYLDELRA